MVKLSSFFFVFLLLGCEVASEDRDCRGRTPGIDCSIAASQPTNKLEATMFASDISTSAVEYSFEQVQYDSRDRITHYFDPGNKFSHELAYDTINRVIEWNSQSNDDESQVMLSERKLSFVCDDCVYPSSVEWKMINRSSPDVLVGRIDYNSENYEVYSIAERFSDDTLIERIERFHTYAQDICLEQISEKTTNFSVSPPEEDEVSESITCKDGKQVERDGLPVTDSCCGSSGSVGLPRIYRTYSWASICS